MEGSATATANATSPTAALCCPRLRNPTRPPATPPPSPRRSSPASRTPTPPTVRPWTLQDPPTGVLPRVRPAATACSVSPPNRVRAGGTSWPARTARRGTRDPRLPPRRTRGDVVPDPCLARPPVNPRHPARTARRPHSPSAPSRRKSRRHPPAHATHSQPPAQPFRTDPRTRVRLSLTTRPRFATLPAGPHSGRH